MSNWVQAAAVSGGTLLILAAGIEASKCKVNSFDLVYWKHCSSCIQDFIDFLAGGILEYCLIHDVHSTLRLTLRAP